MTKRMWCLVCHWKGDPDIWVEQVYGPFDTRKEAITWKREHMDTSWRAQPFALLQPNREAR